MLEILKQLRGGGVNQLFISLNNFMPFKIIINISSCVINQSYKHMDRKSKNHQSHIKYTQRQIFTRKPIKGENLFFFEMIGSLVQFCTSFTIEHQLNVRLLPLFYKLQLVESTNSLFSLAPTRRKHQLPEYSSTNWMEAPTS
jgi:hypothetical protein